MSSDLDDGRRAARHHGANLCQSLSDRWRDNIDCDAFDIAHIAKAYGSGAR